MFISFDAVLAVKHLLIADAKSMRIENEAIHMANKLN